MYSNRTHANRPSALTTAERNRKAPAQSVVVAYSLHSFMRTVAVLVTVAVVLGAAV